MVYRFILLFLVSFSFSVQAQSDRTTDSLLALLNKEKEPKKKTVLLNQISFSLKTQDPLKARQYSEEALQLARKEKDVKGEADALHKKGLSYYYLDSYDTALICYRQSLFLSNRMGDSALVAQAHLGIGNVFRLRGLNDTAVVYLQTALRIYKYLKDPVNIAYCLSTIGDTYLFGGAYEKALEYHQEALALAKEQGDKHREAFCLSSIGNNYHMRGDFNSSIDWHTRSIEAAKEAGEDNIIAGSLGTMADAYSNMYNYPKAIEMYLEALDIAESKNDKHNTAFIYAGMSDIYQRQNDIPNTMKYLLMSIELSKEIGDYNRYCYGQLTLADLKMKANDSIKAREIAWDALNMATTNTYPFHEAWAYRILGGLQMSQGFADNAIYYFRKALGIFTEIGDQKETAETKKQLAKALLNKGNIKEAIAEGEGAYSLSDKISAPGLKMEIAELLSLAYERTGDYTTALKYSRLMKSLGDTLMNAESTKRQTELFLQYQFDKEKEKQRAAQEKKDAEQEARYQQQRLILGIAVAGLILLGVLVFFIFRGYRLKQRSNEIISEQKKIVEEKNREITDSITYARNIQRAMLPADQVISSMFRDHFIFFRPRDIVSGDFYWIGQKGPKKYFAVADCTGHGVPGGFMSMLGITLLNEILDEKGITSPELILDELRAMVIQALNKDRQAGETLTRDGMDISLCCIDETARKISFSGANNGLFILKGSELTELAPDKQPIGVHESMKPFTLKEFELTGGELIVAYSDGYPDQFGGEKGKKLMYPRFRKILQEISSLPAQEQSAHMALAFDEWKEGHAQVDDVCVMGIRI